MSVLSERLQAPLASNPEELVRANVSSVLERVPVSPLSVNCVQQLVSTPNKGEMDTARTFSKVSALVRVLCTSR